MESGFYRFEAQIIGRGDGRCAVAGAAYRSGERLTHDQTGQVFDYKSRHGVRHAETIYPDGTDPFVSRGALWNAVEACERRADAQLAREFLASLPHALTDDQNIALVRGFVRNELTVHGVIADVFMHGPDRRGDLRNVHAHIMTTMRPYRADGTFGPKTELRHLNVKEQLLHWREAWEQHVNRALEQAQLHERVDCRARAATGYAPEPKQGPFATELERQGRRTYAGDDRRQARRERERLERRERERERERIRADTHRSAPAEMVRELQRRVRLALTSISPLLLPDPKPGRDEFAVEHPARDRWWEFRSELRTAEYARHLQALRRAGWDVTTEGTVMNFRRGRTRIENEGGRVRVHGPLSPEGVKAALDTIVANGWTSLRIRSGGTPADKVALVLGALERGLTITAEGADRELVAQLRRVHEASQHTHDVTDRVRARAVDPSSGTPARSSTAQPGAAIDPATPPADEVVVDEALRLLTQQRSVFTRYDLEKTLERFDPNPERVAALTALARNSDDLMDLGVDARGTARFTTRRMFALESRFIEDALAKANERIPRSARQLAAVRDQVKAEYPTMTPDQTQAFDVLTSGPRLLVLRGVAGGGKSFLMNAVREFYERLGMDVYGDALAGVAADGLARESGIQDARTTAQWRVYFDNNPALPNSVHVGDEKGMAGTDDADVLLRKFDVTILVGDNGQLQPISAGAPFRALMDRLPAANIAELRDVRRQNIEWQAQATQLFYDGKSREALKLYNDNGRWVGVPTRDEAKARIVADWTADAKAYPDKSRCVLAYTRADVLDVNMQLRAVRRGWGELAGPDVEIDTTDGPRTFAVNDRVLFREPGRFNVGGSEVKIRNGTPAVVAAIDPERGLLTLRVPELANRRISINLAEYRSVDYADCVTTHTAQGKTVDRAYFLATAQRGMGSDLAYVAMSRQKEDVTLYWSRDQFKNEAQVYRVLTRLTPKDFSLDYSRDAAHMGLGVPNQAPDAIAMRAPYQIRSELLQTVRTASHLRDTMPPDQKVAANRAYAEIREWYYRVDKGLRELEARDVRGVAIQGTATSLRDRLALLDQSVATAVERVQEHVRGRADDRFADLRSEVEQLRTDLAERRAESERIVNAPAVELLAPPVTAIADELGRLTQALEAAKVTDDERTEIGQLEMKVQGRGAGGAEARERLTELRERIHLRQVTAQSELDGARARYADARVVDAMQAAYQERLHAHEALDAQKSAAHELIAEYDRQDGELGVLVEQLDELREHGALTHEQLDRIATAISDRRQTESPERDAEPELVH